MQIYVVERGDSLGSIAGEFGIPLGLLAAENGLDPAGSLLPGQALLIAKARLVYAVQPGDSLYAIARKAGLSLRQLWRFNPWLEASSSIYPGQELVLAYEDSGRQPFFVNGYAYPYIPENILGQSIACLNTLSLFAYGFDEQGNLIPPAESNVVDWGRQRQCGSMLVLAPLDANGEFNNQRISAVLQDAEKRQRLLDQLLAEISRKGMVGVDLDFEYVKPEDAAAYVQFAAELQADLSRMGLRLTIALAPKTSADQPGLLYEGHDYQALGAVADAVTLMTYEWGYTYGPPMAVAPIQEVRRVAEYAITEIPREKILLGMGNYGYDWTLPYLQGRPARSIGNQQALEIAGQYGAEIQFDEESQTPYFFYRAPGGEEHVVWFEDVRSVSAKMALAADLGLAGLSYWTVMRPFIQNWLYLALQYEIQP